MKHKTPIQTKTETKGLHQLRLVSMNLAGCDPSAEAPSSWNRSYVAQIVRHELLKSNPDVLALQECPGPAEAWAKPLFPGYRILGVTSAHAGYVILLVREGLTAASIDTGSNLPAVMAEIQVEGGTSVIDVVSCHLAPFGGGANRRSSQMESLLALSQGRGIPVVIAGDTNMRQEEDAVMEGRFELRDAWKEAGAEKRTKFTWDTRNHLNEEGIGTFNRYYGEDTREYATRYDRIYISKGSNTPSSSSSISVESFELIANQPVNRFAPTHFLSDHFGIACTLKLE